MVKTLTSKFKVETAWPELVNKRIQQIDTHLKEIQFLNQGGSLLAKGSLKRQVKYIDSDGKFRKTEDKLQFEVIIGAAVPEPLPFFTPELRSDYFIFQPRQLGEDQASLEQGFTLIISQYEVVNQETCPFTILTDLVTGKGKGETLYTLPVNLKKDTQPKKFIGTIEFDRCKPPIITGRIIGAIIYRNSHHILKEQEINGSFSFLIDPALKGIDGELIVNGAIIAIDWLFLSRGESWLMDIKLDYNWESVVREELTVWGRVASVGHSELKIKVDLLVKEEPLQFPKSFRVEEDEAGPFEVEPEIKLLNWKRIGCTLLISAVLHFHLYIPDNSGMEKYRTLTFETEELVEGFFERVDEQLNLILDLDSNLGLEKIIYAGPFFLIEAILRLKVKLYQPQVIALIPQNAATEIIGLVPVAEGNFPLLSETQLNLAYPLGKIIKIQQRLSQINSTIKKGLLNLNGASDATVAYLDRQNRYHEESFSLIFQKSYFWEGVKGDGVYKIDLDSKLEHDSFKLENNRLLYKYLWNFTASAYIKRIVKVAISSVKNSTTTSGVFQTKPQNISQEISIQGEIPLQFGNPREIAASRALIAEFSWRNALNAVLVEGRINSEIEYWDEDGFLRRERVEFPFWAFLNRPKFTGVEPILTPRLRRLEYFPLKTWPWRKGSVRYEVEIEINSNSNEGG